MVLKVKRVLQRGEKPGRGRKPGHGEKPGRGGRGEKTGRGGKPGRIKQALKGHRLWWSSRWRGGMLREEVRKLESLSNSLSELLLELLPGSSLPPDA